MDATNLMPTKMEQIEKAARKRGRAYQCLRCLHREGKEVIEVKRRIEAHIIRDHLRRDEVPYFCALCQFRCQREEELQDHVTKFRRHAVIAAESGVNPADPGYLRSNSKPYTICERDYHVMEKEESFLHWKTLLSRKMAVDDPLSLAFYDTFPLGEDEIREILDRGSGASTPATNPTEGSHLQTMTAPQPEKENQDPKPQQRNPEEPPVEQTTEKLAAEQIAGNTQEEQRQQTEEPKALDPRSTVVSLSCQGLKEAVTPILASLTSLLGPDKVAELIGGKAAEEEEKDKEIAKEKEQCGTGLGEEPEDKTKDRTQEQTSEAGDQVENLMPQLLPSERQTLSPVRTPKRQAARGFAPIKRMPSIAYPSSDSSDADSEDEEAKTERDSLREALRENTKALRSMERTMLTLASAVATLAKKFKESEKVQKEEKGEGECTRREMVEGRSKDKDERQTCTERRKNGDEGSSDKDKRHEGEKGQDMEDRRHRRGTDDRKQAAEDRESGNRDRKREAERRLDNSPKRRRRSWSREDRRHGRVDRQWDRNDRHIDNSRWRVDDRRCNSEERQPDADRTDSRTHKEGRFRSGEDTRLVRANTQDSRQEKDSRRAKDSRRDR